ncbi:polyketide cyclase / dehydrase and lipid transport [Aquipuribacter hungaricus]|uniref:Polyketide cyclase / dehydrase and lipid transport n=1 Tax=Aquipuribacter hungaricus TaxID=545624 RepID=A0ABV7WIL7_9MICO
MPLVDVVDDTFLRAPRRDVRGRTGTRWASWLPDLDLVVTEDRDEQGLRWSACTRPGRRTAALQGSAEVWLEEVAGGTVAHLYVRLDPVAPGARAARSDRRARRLPDRLRRTWKLGLHGWKDGQEGDRSR